MGPTVSIVLDQQLDAAALHALEAFLSSVRKISPMKTERNQHSWNLLPEAGECLCDVTAWNGNIGEAYGSYELDASELDQIESVIGFRPAGQIQVDAFCNGENDHRFAGEIALGLLELFGGMADFGGVLTNAGTFEGRLLNLYEGDEISSQFADKEFLESYLKSPDFRLIK